MGLVVIPVLGYFLGTLIGIHMSASDVDQGYAYGGLLYTVYNATHNPVYSQEAQISQAQGDCRRSDRHFNSSADWSWLRSRY